LLSFLSLLSSFTAFFRLADISHFAAIAIIDISLLRHAFIIIFLSFFLSLILFSAAIRHAIISY